MSSGTYTGSAHSATSEAVRVVYFDGQKQRVSVASFKRVVKSLKVLGLSDDEAKVAVLTIFDYATKWLQEKLVSTKTVTQDQIDRSRF